MYVITYHYEVQTKIKFKWTKKKKKKVLLYTYSYAHTWNALKSWFQVLIFELEIILLDNINLMPYKK